MTPLAVKQRWRDSSLWDDIEDGVGVAAGVVCGFATYIVYLSIVLALTPAILGESDSHGPRAWYVMGPAVVIGFVLVPFSYLGARAAAMNLYAWIVRRLRGSGP